MTFISKGFLLAFVCIPNQIARYSSETQNTIYGKECVYRFYGFYVVQKEIFQLNIGKRNIASVVIDLLCSYCLLCSFSLLFLRKNILVYRISLKDICSYTGIYDMSIIYNIVYYLCLQQK